MTNNENRSVFKSRRFKYGSLAVALTVLLIALVIVLNAAVYALTYSFGWYLDLTGEQYYGITEKSTSLLDTVLTPGVKVQITFCQDKDRVLDDDAGYYVYKCVQTYQEEYPDNVSVKFLDINKHPELIEKYTTQRNMKLYTYSIIMETEKNARVFDYDDFFVFDENSNVYAFHGENRFTSYIISVCNEAPICYFITGHGESYAYTDSENRVIPCALYEFLQKDVGYDVREIDLSKPESTLDDAKVIVIYDPAGDYSNAELDKIGAFMSDKTGNAMVFLSPENAVKTGDSTALVRLKNWLRTWGVEVYGKVTDYGDNSLANSGGSSIIATYPTELDGSFAVSLHSYLRQLPSQPKTIIDNALAFTCPWENNTAAAGFGERNYDAILLSGDHASVGEEKNRQYEIAALVRQVDNVDELDSVYLTSYLLVTSTGYATTEYLSSSSYGNRDILSMLATQMGKQLVPLGIEIKVFGSEALNISTGAAYVWTVVLVGVMPCAVLTVGAIVCFRRKRS